MRFRTELKLPPSDLKITHSDPIMLIGSCFSTSIGQKMIDLKYDAEVNPFGTIYHPHAITRDIASINHSANPEKNDRCIVRLNDRYVHYDYHSDLSAKTAGDLDGLIQQTKRQTYKHLQRSNILFITLGTAYYFYHKSLDHIVANCHKQPNGLFERRLSSYDELIIDLNLLVESVKSIKSDIKIVFTVSPVRHVRDGLIANARSKSLLISAVHEIIQSTEATYYFPAYELMMDDLRDYRYYTADLIHPNDQGIEYIWSYVERHYLTEEAIKLNKKILNIKNALMHRPFDARSTDHQKLLYKTLQEIESLESEYNLNFVEEKIQLANIML